MLIRLLLSLSLILILSGVGRIGSPGVRDSVLDKQAESRLAVLDAAVVMYYRYHSGQLPSSLDSDTLAVMGLEQDDAESITYTRLADRRFRLRAVLKKGGTLDSAHSDMELPVPKAEER